MLPLQLRASWILGSLDPEKQVPFGYAQGRLSTPLKCASLRMTGLFLYMNTGDETPETISTMHFKSSKAPSGAKARSFVGSFAARLKPCPFKAAYYIALGSIKSAL
jgi:hypothetical protein